MKGFAVVALFGISITLVWGRPEEEKYTDQFDNIDVDEILHSERLLDNYFNCVKTGKKCTPDGQKLKEILPDALKTNCQKCTDRQKEISKKVIKFLVESKPKMFKDLEDQFDPEHNYRKEHAETLKKEGIVLPD